MIFYPGLLARFSIVSRRHLQSLVQVLYVAHIRDPVILLFLLLCLSSTIYWLYPIDSGPYSMLYSSPTIESLKEDRGLFLLEKNIDYRVITESRDQNLGAQDIEIRL